MNPLLALIERFNWVDIFFIILLLRIGYVASKSGFISEFFKLLGVLMAIYVAMHYYTDLSDFLRGRFELDERLPLDFLDFFCFILLVGVSYILSILLRQTFSMFIKLEAIPRLNRWGGFIMGITRAILLIGLFTFIFSITTLKYMHDKVAQSYLGPRLINVAPATYSRIWYGFMSKFMPNEKFNKTILEVQKNFNP
jgi:membrane protein required for colicin V production